MEHDPVDKTVYFALSARATVRVTYEADLETLTLTTDDDVPVRLGAYRTYIVLCCVAIRFAPELDASVFEGLRRVHRKMLDALRQRPRVRPSQRSTMQAIESRARRIFAADGSVRRTARILHKLRRS